jgi:hypothetical protein
MALIGIVFAVFIVLMAYELISGRIFLRGWKTVTREEQPELYWTTFALQTMGILIGLAAFLYFQM